MKTKANDLTVYYERTGEGRPLLLLHGNGGTCRSFDGVIEALRARFTCYLLDTRWHGRTTRGDVGMSYVQFGSDLAAFVAELGLEKPHIIGYSDGGITALEYAAHSRNVGKIIALGANWDETGTTEEFLAYMRATEAFWGRHRWIPGAKRKRALMELMLAKESYGGWDSLANVTSPVLLMAGDQDVIPYEHTQRIHAALPTSRVVIVPDCGHSIMREQKEIFLKESLEFLGCDGKENGVTPRG